MSQSTLFCKHHLLPGFPFGNIRSKSENQMLTFELSYFIVITKCDISFAPASIVRGHVVFWPVCLSVHLFVCPQKLYISHIFLLITVRAYKFH